LNFLENKLTINLLFRDIKVIKSHRRVAKYNFLLRLNIAGRIIMTSS
jgi:hypothetical protein